MLRHEGTASFQLLPLALARGYIHISHEQLMDEGAHMLCLHELSCTVLHHFLFPMVYIELC
jgi:hypothetical protein